MFDNVYVILDKDGRGLLLSEDDLYELVELAKKDKKCLETHVRVVLNKNAYFNDKKLVKTITKEILNIAKNDK